MSKPALGQPHKKRKRADEESDDIEAVADELPSASKKGHTSPASLLMKISASKAIQVSSPALQAFGTVDDSQRFSQAQAEDDFS